MTEEKEIAAPAASEVTAPRLAGSARRDWVIAITAAVLGVVGVPTFNYFTKLVGSGPHLSADMAYGPYYEIPDDALSKFGYSVPKIRNAIKVSGDGGIVSEVKPGDLSSDADIGRDFGRAPSEDEYSPKDLFARIQIRNSGAAPAESVYLFDPFLGIVALADGKVERTIFVQKEGSKVPIGELLPGQTKIVRLWFSSTQGSPPFEAKSTDRIGVFFGSNQTPVTVHKRGHDSAASYVASYLGLGLFAVLGLGTLLLFALAASLLTAAFKFLLPDLYSRLSTQSETKR